MYVLLNTFFSSRKADQPHLNPGDFTLMLVDFRCEFQEKVELGKTPPYINVHRLSL